jgi:hypothetical protein
MSEPSTSTKQHARLRYHRPEIERIGSIAEITAASSNFSQGVDNANGYAESTHSPS